MPASSYIVILLEMRIIIWALYLLKAQWETWKTLPKESYILHTDVLK